MRLSRKLLGITVTMIPPVFERVLANWQANSLKEPISFCEKFLLHGKLEESGDRMVKENIQQTEMMEDIKKPQNPRLQTPALPHFFPL